MFSDSIRIVSQWVLVFNRRLNVCQAKIITFAYLHTTDQRLHLHLVFAIVRLTLLLPLNSVVWPSDTSYISKVSRHTMNQNCKILTDLRLHWFKDHNNVITLLFGVIISQTQTCAKHLQKCKVFQAHFKDQTITLRNGCRLM